jgi:hypothetical protein
MRLSTDQTPNRRGGGFKWNNVGGDCGYEDPVGIAGIIRSCIDFGWLRRSFPVRALMHHASMPSLVARFVCWFTRSLASISNVSKSGPVFCWSGVSALRLSLPRGRDSASLIGYGTLCGTAKPWLQSTKPKDPYPSVFQSALALRSTRHNCNLLGFLKRPAPSIPSHTVIVAPSV